MESPLSKTRGKAKCYSQNRYLYIVIFNKSQEQWNREDWGLKPGSGTKKGTTGIKEEGGEENKTP